MFGEITTKSGAQHHETANLFSVSNWFRMICSFSNDNLSDPIDSTRGSRIDTIQIGAHLQKANHPVSQKQPTSSNFEPINQSTMEYVCVCASCTKTPFFLMDRNRAFIKWSLKLLRSQLAVAHNMSKDSLSSWATSTNFSCINDSYIFIHSISASFLDLQGFLRIANLKSSTCFLEFIYIIVILYIYIYYPFPLVKLQMSNVQFTGISKIDVA